MQRGTLEGDPTIEIDVGIVVGPAVSFSSLGGFGIEGWLSRLVLPGGERQKM
jgi:hypothetical protein